MLLSDRIDAGIELHKTEPLYVIICRLSLVDDHLLHKRQAYITDLEGVDDCCAGVRGRQDIPQQEDNESRDEEDY